jgi:hypothetical protein
MNFYDLIGFPYSKGLFGTFRVSQAKSVQPIKALEKTSLSAFTQIEEEPFNGIVTTG